MYNINRI